MTTEYFANRVMARRVRPAYGTKRKSACVHRAHRGGIVGAVLPSGRLRAACHKVVGDGVIPVLLISNPLKIRRAVIGFDPVAMIDLRQTERIWNENGSDEAVNLVYPSVEVDPLVALLRERSEGVHLCSHPSRHRLAPIEALVSGSAATHTTKRTNLVFVRQSRDQSPLFHNRHFTAPAKVAALPGELQGAIA